MSMPVRQDWVEPHLEGGDALRGLLKQRLLPRLVARGQGQQPVVGAHRAHHGGAVIQLLSHANQEDPGHRVDVVQVLQQDDQGPIRGCKLAQDLQAGRRGQACQSWGQLQLSHCMPPAGNCWINGWPNEGSGRNPP